MQMVKTLANQMKKKKKQASVLCMVMGTVKRFLRNSLVKKNKNREKTFNILLNTCLFEPPSGIYANGWQLLKQLAFYVSFNSRLQNTQDHKNKYLLH